MCTCSDAFVRLVDTHRNGSHRSSIDHPPSARTIELEMRLPRSSDTSGIV